MLERQKDVQGKVFDGREGAESRWQAAQLAAMESEAQTTQHSRLCLTDEYDHTSPGLCLPGLIPPISQLGNHESPALSLTSIARFEGNSLVGILYSASEWAKQRVNHKFNHGSTVHVLPCQRRNHEYHELRMLARTVAHSCAWHVSYSRE